MSSNSKESKKLLVWTWTDIHNMSGTPAILITLFSLMQEWRITYVCGNKSQTKQPIGRSMKMKYYHLIDKMNVLIARNNWLLVLLLDFCVKIPVLTTICIYTVLKERPQAILTVFFNRSWVLSSFLTAKILRRKVIFYVHDPFKEKYLMRTKLERSMMYYIERKIMTDKLSRIIVLNEGLEELYRVYKPSTVLPNISMWKVKKAHSHRKLDKNELFKIAFSGSVYENNRELVYALVDVVSRNPDCELHMFGNYGRDDVSYFNSVSNVIIRFIPGQELLFNQLLNYDLQYLPLSFVGHKDLPIECLRPVFPTKAMDYISTNKPILLHCPEDFFLASYFKKHGIGYCLHSREIKDLEIVLQELVMERKKYNLSLDEYEKLMYEFSVEKNISIINSIFY